MLVYCILGHDWDLVCMSNCDLGLEAGGFLLPVIAVNTILRGPISFSLEIRVTSKGSLDHMARS